MSMCVTHVLQRWRNWSVILQISEAIFCAVYVDSCKEYLNLLMIWHNITFTINSNNLKNMTIYSKMFVLHVDSVPLYLSFCETCSIHLYKKLQVYTTDGFENSRTLSFIESIFFDTLLLLSCWILNITHTASKLEFQG